MVQLPAGVGKGESATAQIVVTAISRAGVG
jgi:hypothetical protein